MKIDNIVKLWHKTQIGHHLKCRKAQIEFSDIMWKLHDKLKKESSLFSEQQSLGDEAV